jgi:hypothetical protein
MLNPDPIDFTPLINALQKAQGKATFGEQRLQIELAIVASEMNPEPDTFCDLLWAIEAIGEIDFTTRVWKPVEPA